MLKTDNNTGPNIFLNRLNKNLEIPDNVFICNPDSDSLSNAKKISETNDLIIARFDGAYFYKFTFKEILGFLAHRGYLPEINFASNISQEPSKILSRLINNYLNQNIRWLLNNSEGFIFQSKISKAIYDKYLGTSNLNNFKIINNGVDIKLFHPSNRTSEFKNNFPNIVISASSYRPLKRLSDAVKLTNSLAATYPDICLHVIGTIGPIVKKELKNLSLDYCKFYGKLGLDDLPNFYSSCDLQFCLGLYDACPNVAVEGLASGLPVITPTLSGAFDLIDENIDWSIDESKMIERYENHRPNAFPSINTKQYIAKIQLVIEDLIQQKEKARYIAEKKLDIDIVSKSYIDFINETKDRNLN